MRNANIATVVRWFHRLRGFAPGWVGALVVALMAAPGPGEAVVLNPGDILIVDSEQAEVILVNPAGGGQTPVASGSPLHTPIGVAVATNGALYVLDLGCCGPNGGQPGVIQVDPANGNQTVVTFGDKLASPQGIAVSETGRLYVVDDPSPSDPPRVIEIDPAGGHQTVVLSGPPLATPAGIAVATSGDPFVYVIDPGCCVGGGVIKVNPVTGTPTVVSQGGHFVSPNSIAIAANGDLFVLDPDCCSSQGGVIRVNPVDGTQVPVPSAPVNHFVGPNGIAIGSTHDLLVVDTHCCSLGDGGVIQVSPATGAQTVVSQGQHFANPFAIAVVPPSTLPPPSACGGSVPCACGDRVVKDRTLRGADPVTRTVCVADGLVVAGGVTLDLGGATLRGQGAGAGVRIEAGATDARVRGGRITGFATGVRGEGTTGVRLANLQVIDSSQDGVTLTGDGHTVEVATIQGNGGHGVVIAGHASRLSRLQVRGNGRAGIRMIGNNHTLEHSGVRGNGERGAEVSGDGNEVTLLQVEANGGDGVFMTGTANQTTRNTATRNGGDGLQILGVGATVDSNRATSNREAGLEISGTAHTVTSNIAGLNAGTGLEMLGTTGSRFDRNRGENNGGFGITDDSTGTGTSGTANTYTRNICGRGNAAGVSFPADLCR